MSDSLPKELAVLDAPQRLRALELPLLDRTPDERLQELVSRASQVSGFPTALVSLVTRSLQFFRAHVGLPPELEASLATDRCNSFCQFVVAGGRPLEIEDTQREPGLPQDLVERYGIRAYVGFPLQVQGQVVGSFCVFDMKPGRVGEAQREQLQGLAREASERLEELARGWAPSTEDPRDTQAHQSWLAVAEAQSLVSLSEQFALGRLSPEEFQRALGALAGLTRSDT